MDHPEMFDRPDLYISHSSIDNTELEVICDTLKDNCVVESLIVCDNKIGDEGAKKIAGVLQVNTTLHTLEIRCNEIGAIGVKAIVEALKVNKTLKFLAMYGSEIGDEGAKAIAEALKVNDTLVVLRIGGSQIGEEGAKAIAEALKVNKTLHTLIMYYNPIRNEGVEALSEMLKINRTLRELDIDDHSIGNRGIKAVCNALKVNTTLNSLDIHDTRPTARDVTLNSLDVRDTAEDDEISDMLLLNDTLWWLMRRNSIPQQELLKMNRKHDWDGAKSVLASVLHEWCLPLQQIDIVLHYMLYYQKLEKDLKSVLANYFKTNGLCAFQFESYHKFVNYNFPQLAKHIRLDLKCTNPLCVENFGTEYSVYFENVYYTHPKNSEHDVFRHNDIDFLSGTVNLTTPMEARLRKLTYAMSIYADVVLEKRKLQKDGNVQIERETKKHFSGDVPVMVRSDYCRLNRADMKDIYKLKECPLDPGGYFIIKGGEKVIMPQDRLLYNHPIVFKRDNHYQMEIRCSSTNFDRFYINKLWIHYKETKQTFTVSIPYVKKLDIPLGILFQAYGVRNHKELVETIMNTTDISDARVIKLLHSIINENFDVAEKDVDYAVYYIAHFSNNHINRDDRKAVTEYGKDMIYDELLCHLGNRKTNPNCIVEKRYYLGYMVKKFIDTIVGNIQMEDRDNFEFKRVETICELSTQLANHYLKKSMRDAKNELMKIIESDRPVTLDAFMPKQRVLTTAFNYHYGNGKWAFNNPTKTSKNGVSAALLRTNFIAAVTHLNKINNNIDRDTKLITPRELQGTRVGVECPYDTPDSKNVGLVNNLSCLTRISVGSDPSLLNDIVFRYAIPLIDTTLEQRRDYYKIFVNGIWKACTNRPGEFVTIIRTLRRRMQIDFEASVRKHDVHKIVYINVDEGRFLQPFLLINPQTHQIALTHERVLQYLGNNDMWLMLMAEGLIEYCDKMEQQEMLVAPSLIEIDVSKRYTHVEVHPAALLGHSAATIPYINHNPAARNTFAAAQIKQAKAGPMAFNSRERMDSSIELMYSQRPLVYNDIGEMCGFNELNVGVNINLAIISGTGDGYTQEDAILLNQRSVDLGMFRSYDRKIECIEQKKSSKNEEEICCPVLSLTKGINRDHDYSMLEEDGIIGMGLQIKKGVVLVGKTLPLYNSDNNPEFKRARDCSLVNRKQGGVVTKVMISTQNEDKIVKAEITTVKIPEIGDKFSSRHGQKGVIGRIMAYEDMPFTADGVVPDAVINCHAIPSRMTIGQMIEMVAGKIVALGGKKVNATPFEQYDFMHDLESTLHNLGYVSTGEEVMYNGETGRRIPSQIFMGPCYYVRLKQQVSDKVHSRAEGPINILTHAPVESRNKDGALKFGEMEREAVEAHGASNILNSFTKLSDETRVVYCRICGVMCYKNHETGQYVCRKCAGLINMNIESLSGVDYNNAFFETTTAYACKLLIQELQAMGIKSVINSEE